MGYSYGYNRAERIDDYKSAREFVLVLCDLVSRGGNLLLDIGPNADGTIPVIMEQRLLEIGDWLRVNGEAIYGTRYAGRSCQWSEGKRPGQQYGEFMVKYNLMDQVGQKPHGDMAVKQAFFTKKPGAVRDYTRLARQSSSFSATFASRPTRRSPCSACRASWPTSSKATC